MIIENRSKNVQVFHTAGESVILEIGSNTLDARQSKELKAHRLFDANIQAGILKITQDEAPFGITEARIEETQEIVIEAEESQEGVEIKIKKRK